MPKTLMLMEVDNSKRKKQKESTPTNVSIEREESVDDEIKTCRVCLKDGNIPIYGDEHFADISQNVSTFGNIVLRLDDIHPKYLCESCQALLQGAILFRRMAQESDKFLKQPSPTPSYLFVEDEDFNTDLDDEWEDDPVNYVDLEYEVEGVKFEGNDSEEKQAVYCCKRCNLDFETKEEYLNHRLSEEHENKKKVMCPICNNAYSHRYIKNHLAIHKKEHPYMCDVCGKKFPLIGPFSRHRKTHSHNLPFQCSLCPYKGRFRESLKRHMMSHTGEKPYRCPQCPTRFVNTSNLSRHLLTHKGDRDFKCDQCPRGFYTQRELEAHYKVDHKGIKDFMCNVCSKTFGYRKQLMKHQRKVHKREKLRGGRTPVYLLVKKQQDTEILNE